MAEQMVSQLADLLVKRDKMVRIMRSMRVDDSCLPYDFETLWIFDTAIGVRLQDLGSIGEELGLTRFSHKAKSPGQFRIRETKRRCPQSPFFCKSR